MAARRVLRDLARVGQRGLGKMNQVLLRKKDVAQLLGVHSATLMRWTREGLFPKPFRPGGQRGSVRWHLETVESWLSNRAA